MKGERRGERIGKVRREKEGKEGREIKIRDKQNKGQNQKERIRTSKQKPKDTLLHFEHDHHQ
jgi:hypothetical protein